MIIASTIRSLDFQLSFKMNGIDAMRCDNGVMSKLKMVYSRALHLIDEVGAFLREI